MRFDTASISAWLHAGPKVGDTIDPHETTTAVAIHTEESPWPVVLERAPPDRLPRDMKGGGDGLSLKGSDGSSVKVNGERRVADGVQTLGHTMGYQKASNWGWN